MTIILALFLVLWVWGRFEMFALHIGRAITSKIDFISSDNYVLVWRPRISRNMENPFPQRESLEWFTTPVINNRLKLLSTEFFLITSALTYCG